MSAPVLQIQNLKRSYAGRSGIITPVDEVSLTVNKGEFIAIQGPSGCGKSTLLLTCGGLLTPDSGSVRLAGADMYTMSANDRARHRAAHVGFVFQQFHLIPYLDVLDNVMAPMVALRVADGKEKARELLSRFGLDRRIHHVPAALSTGERQRAALARALIHNPALLLADEPTGNLDETNGEAVLSHLAAFAAGGGSVLLVTHDHKAATHADRIVQMRDGKISKP